MIFAILWLLCGFIGMMIGSKKGEGCGGFMLGVLLGPIGVIIIMLVRGQRKPCLACKELINKKATVCPHCRTAVA